MSAMKNSTLVILSRGTDGKKIWTSGLNRLNSKRSQFHLTLAVTGLILFLTRSSTKPNCRALKVRARTDVPLRLN